MSSQNKYTSCKKASVNAAMPGFALVATLLLMILLSILAMGLLSLSSVSLRNSGNNSSEAEARANARMALMQAIGELQRQLGPDQRISMTADQRTDPDGDGSITSSAVGNRYWTGVYDSWLGTTADRPTPVFRSWLVSGDPATFSQPEAPETALSGADVIELVGPGTLGSAANGVVKVPTVSVTPDGSSSGRMAWWVGDQGVKAAMATPPPSTDTTLGVIRNNLQTAPHNAVELAAVGTEKPFSALSPDDPQMQLVTGWGQTAFLASGVGAHLPLFHDLAGSSTGMLTNVRDGGFRKDLSMKMETFTSPPSLTDPENILYTANSQMTGNNEVGINFMELWGYYNLYKELKYGAGLTYTTGGSVPSTTPYLQTKNTPTDIVADVWDRFKHPITINWQAIFSFEVAPYTETTTNPDGTTQTRTFDALFLNFDPVVTIWNPLDVAVDIPKHATWNYLYSFWVIPYDINVKVNGGTERVCSLLETSNNKGDANYLHLNAGVVERITLKPGEVVKISQEGATQSSNSRGAAVGGFQGLSGKKGFSYGGGSRLPLLDKTLKTIEVAPSDTISYTATPNGMGAGGAGTANSQRFSLTHATLELGGRGGLVQGHLSIDDRAGYTRVQVGQFRDMSGQRSMPNPLDVRANDGSKFVEVFPRIEGATMTRELQASTLKTDKATFMIQSYAAKTEEENLSGSRMFSRFNPRAYNLNFYDLTKQERDMMPFEAQITGLTSWFDAPLDETTSGQGFFGSSLGAQFGSSFVNTHAVPRQPIVSLGALQDSFANGINMPTKLPNTGSAAASYPLLPQISHAIGNSLAPPVIPPDKTTSNLSNYPHPLADHSYLANRELWDDYFFSGITPQSTPAFAANKDQKTFAIEFFEGTQDLPVVRYRPVKGDLEASELVTPFFSGVTPTQEAITNLASHLRVDGLFNINSTSVEAWKALLGSLKDRPIVVRDESGAESIAAKDGKTPVTNIGAPRDVIIEDDSGLDPEQWYGRRVLSDDELASLAQGIVKEVRKRGPFLSLADFVNRRVGTDTDLARAGAIQNALDSDDVTINQNQNSDRAVDSTTAGRFAFPEAEEGAKNYGAPSIVKQGDILTPIAPVLSARSDSFIIRAYGEALDNQGNVAARAWCEAIVERDREYVDPADSPETLPAALTKEINQGFGRRFNMISFRWLNSSEI